MKAIIFVVVLGAAAYWGWNYYNHRMVKDPVYAEFRVKYENGIELVGLGKMNSQSDCERRAAEFWRSVLASDARAEISAIRCDIQLPIRYETLFSNQVATATYIAMDRGNSGERDGRFIIFGAPSSDVIKICPSLIETIKRKYSGTVQCIQGSVG